MPVLHIIAVGPQGSGKSTLVRHLAKNPPDGYKLELEDAKESAYGQEYWLLKFKKIKTKRKRA